MFHNPTSNRGAAARLVATLLLGLSITACGERDGPDRIILIVADTLRRDVLSPYGSKLATPHLQRLADEGSVFENAISSFHQTTMSMSSLFTGRTPSLETGDRSTILPWTSRGWCGLARLAESPEDTCIPRGLDTLAEDLKRAGYETLGIQSNWFIFRPYGYEQGFDTWIEVGEKERSEDQQGRSELAQLRMGDRVNEQAATALQQRESDRFFLYVHYVDPHDYGIRPDLKSYEDSVRYLDRVVGELLEELREAALLENAVVIFTSDHGESFAERDDHPLPAMPGHFGNPSFDSVLKVPLIISPPQPGDVAALVRGQDMYGLIREIAGLPPSAAADIAPDEVFLAEQYYQTYRRGRWKSSWARNKGQMALFDLHRDPGEKQNVADSHPDIVQQHRDRIAELTQSLAASVSEDELDAGLTPDEEKRLRALGYIK
ncbi:MAG: sulfatase [Myxococcota bacterium]|nr:sulfatase [Myxococcota bacterium]